MKNGKKNTCPLTDEIVSYIYGEIGGKAEYDFETHLAECTACTDEFAAVSDSRFSVFEWKKEAFDPLPTPAFEVPFERPTRVAETGFIAAVKAWAQSLSIPVAVAATLLLVVGVWVIVFALGKKQEPPVAANIGQPTAQPEPKREVKAPDVVPPIGESKTDTAEIKRPAKQTVKPIPASMVKQKRVVKAPTMLAVKNPSNDLNKLPQIQKAPALNAYQENDDQSLRLAELFDEVGG